MEMAKQIGFYFAWRELAGEGMRMAPSKRWTAQPF